MGLIITLILLGLVLIFAEILLIPGIGVAGILGLLSIGGSCFYAFHQMGTTVGVIVTVADAALLVALTIWVLRAKTWKKLTLETTVDGKAVDADEEILVGERGVTVTRLAPMGMVRFGGESVEVKALEGMIDPGVDVEVVMIEDKKIYVQPVGEDF